MLTGRMTKRKRDVLSMAMSGAVVLVLHFSVFRPPERDVARSRKEASELSGKVKDAARKIASFPGLAMKIEEYREKVASIKEKTGALSNSRDVAEILVNDAKKLGLDVSILRNADSRAAEEGDGHGKAISFRVQMPCSYRSFAEYVEAIEKAGETIAVTEITLTRPDAAAKALMGELTVTATVIPQ